MPRALLLPPDAGLDAIPRLELPDADLDALARGQVVGLAPELRPARGGAPSRTGRRKRPSRRAPSFGSSTATAASPRWRTCGRRRLFPDKVFVAPAVVACAYPRRHRRTARRLERICATVGVFDGLHRGHAQVLGVLGEVARRLEAVPTVITFDPHPEAIVRGRAPALIMDPDERLERLAEAGVGITVVQRFDEAFRRTTARGLPRAPRRRAGTSPGS